MLGRWGSALALSILVVVGCDNEKKVVDGDADGHPETRDCNDANASIFPGADEVPYDGIDQDCSGADLVDVDEDGHSAVAVGGDDCDDNNVAISPDAEEIPYDGLDQDCSGNDLEDVDDDGYVGLDAGGDDCDDERADAHPAGVESCGDGVDQDCSGIDLPCSDADLDGDGYSTNAGDCNDDDSSINPAAEETHYNGRDDDCDAGTPDDDVDGDGFLRDGGGDCDDMDETVFPGADEIPYDGVDQDCSGSDEDDVDNDTHAAVVAGGDDCDDMRADVNPGIAEVPHDGVDQDCDGSDFIGVPIPITADGSAGLPDATWGDAEYLVVWLDLRSGLSEIYGRFVLPDGGPGGSDFLIATAPTDQSVKDPRVAYDGENFLVIWNQNMGGNRGQVRGQFIDVAGALVGGDFQISASAWTPSIAFGAGTFMVAYQTVYSSNFYQVRTIAVASDGTISASAEVHTSGVITVGFPPDIAFDGTNFMVVLMRQIHPWLPGNPEGVWARLIQPDGTVAGPEIDLSEMRPTEFFVPGPAVNVAFDGTNYLAVITADGNVFGQFVDTSGTLVYTAADSSFEVSSAVGRQDYAEVAFVGGDYTTVFVDDRLAIAALYAQRVGEDSSLLGPTAFQNEPLIATDAVAGAPRVASAGTSALVVWPMDGNIQATVIER